MSRITNLFVMHGIAVGKSQAQERENERQKAVGAQSGSGAGCSLPPRELAAPFNPRRFSNDLPAAATGEGEKRKMDKITADIKAALKCTRGRKMASAPCTFCYRIFRLGQMEL